jgi:hypothetical protein
MALCKTFEKVFKWLASSAKVEAVRGFCKILGNYLIKFVQSFSGTQQLYKSLQGQ